MHFEQIYRTEAPRIAQYLRRLRVPADEIDDMVHEVFVVLLRRAPGLDDAGSIRGWLFIVARHVNHNRARTLRRRRPEHGPSSACLQPDQLPDATLPSADEVVAFGENRARLQRAMARLDHDKRDVLMMTEQEDMTAAQIAKLKQLSPNTVSSRLRAARSELRRALEESTPLQVQ